MSTSVFRVLGRIKGLCYHAWQRICIFQTPSYLAPRNWGCFPRALVSVSTSILRLSVCVMEMTVAATYGGGGAMKEQGAMRMFNQNKMTLVLSYILGMSILRSHLKASQLAEFVGQGIRKPLIEPRGLSWTGEKAPEPFSL